MLTNAVGLQWDKDSTLTPIPGQTLDSCNLNVEVGLAQLEFIRGSTVILRGPVEFEIKGANEGSLKTVNYEPMSPRC